MILGDSLAATDFGRALEGLVDEAPGLEARRRGKSATGLARPDFFDWMAEGEVQVEQNDPDLVVVILGGNDGQDLIDRDRRRRRVIWGRPGWAEAYADRVTAFVETLAARPHRRVVWLALPVMDRPGLERKLTTIRAVQRAALAAHPRAEYLETRAWFVDEGGATVRTIELEGERYPLRQDDGVHFSRPGARWFAERVAPALIRRFSGSATAGATAALDPR